MGGPAGPIGAGAGDFRIPPQPRISPDGTRALFDAPSPDGDDEVFLADLVRGTSVRLSADPQDDFDAVWSRDGRWVVWTAMSVRGDAVPGHASRPTAPGSRVVVPVPRPRSFRLPSRHRGCSPTRARTAAGAFDIWIVPLTGDRKPRPFLATAVHGVRSGILPGRQVGSLTYRDESGTHDVYVSPFPGPGAKRRVTTGGGASPAWSRDGRGSFTSLRCGPMAVSVTAAPTALRRPRQLFSGGAGRDRQQR